jgi:DtxR family Mn-dependent transcriptional regulator
MAHKLTLAEENYLTAVLRLEWRNQKVTTNAIAGELHTKASSVTDMMQKLATKKLVNYSKYKAVSLTNSGKQKAVHVIRKHRLWEVFLVEKLGFRWNEVHLLAEQLEHIDSEVLVDRLDDFLGNPHTDPHGDPIPDRYGKMQHRPASRALAACKAGQHVVVVGVKNSSDDFLRFLDDLGIKLGLPLKIVRIFDFDESVEIQIGNQKNIVLNKQITHNLLVNDNKK